MSDNLMPTVAVNNSNLSLGESSYRTWAPGADFISHVRVQQLLCGETGLAGAILCKGRDHRSKKGESLIAVQKCPAQGVSQPNKTAPGSSGGGMPFTRPRTRRGERRRKAAPSPCYITVRNVSEADLAIRAMTFSQRHVLKSTLIKFWAH